MLSRPVSPKSPFLFICLAAIVVPVFVAESGAGIPRQQPEDMKVTWGQVSVAELRDTTYPGDENATAVVLYERGYATFDEEFNLIFTLHRRIKILNAAGFGFGTVSLSFYDEVQEIDDLEGLTMVLGPDGNIVRNKLNSDDIFEENIGESVKRIKFTLPSLAPGCIVEYRYKKRSTNAYYFPNWYFQDSEPTLWSEFEVQIPGVFGYAFVSFPGFQKFYVETSGTRKQAFKTAYGMQIVDVAASRWVMKDMPAVREEEYMTTARDYTANVTFQLSQVQWPGEMPVKVLQSWEKLVEELMDHKLFGGALEGSGDITRLAQSLCSGIPDTLGKLAALHRYVSSTIVWDGRYSVFGSGDLDDVMKVRKGGTGDINLLLIALLRSAGIEAAPVLISTRGHGRIQRIYPMADQFNDVICAAMAGGKWIMMDATDRLRPYHLLPPQALNHSGLLIRNETPVWVNIEPPGKSEIEKMATMTLRDDGVIEGTLVLNFKEYAAYEARKSLGETKHPDFVKSYFESSQSGFTADSIVVENLDSIDLPLSVRAAITMNSHVQVLDSFMYLNPNIFTVGENPFKREQRRYPVDYGYGISRSSVVNFTLPEHYEVVERPPDINAALTNNGGSFTRRIQAAHPQVQYQTRTAIRQLMFNPNEYASLRAMYDRIVTSGTEPMVLRRRGETGSGGK